MTETVTFPLETKITEPIAKRIRALKKRSNKKYDLTLELNEDQKQALAKQESLLLVIKELEDLQLALSNVEVKLAKESSLQLAALDERLVQDKNHLLELAGLVSTLPSLNKSHIDPELVSALFHVRSILVDSNNAAPVFTNLANKSSDLFHGFSFASLHQALLDIKNPPQIIPVKETKLNFFTSPVLDDSAIIEYQVLKEPVKEPKKKVVYTAEEKRIYKEKKRLELLKQESNASNDKEIQVQEPEKVQVTTTTSSKPRKIKRRQSKKQLVEPAYEPDSIQPEYVEPTALVEGPIVRQKSNVSFAENVDDNEKPYFKRIPKEKRYYSKKPSLSDVSAAVA